MPDEPLQGQDGGGWSEDAHNTLYPGNFNKGLAHHLCQRVAPLTALEFGSGLGYLARYIVDHSAVTRYDCIEPSEIKGQYSPDAFPKLHSVDIFNDAIDHLFLDAYDMVVSIEVAEHIDRSLHERLFDFLVLKAARTIVFSGARIGQGGHGHIAERHEEDWREEFLTRGCTYLSEATAEIRNACDEKNINHRQNLMVFAI